MIAAGRVRVGGEIVTRPGTKVDPRRDEIRVDGVRVRPDRPRRYILLHKPAGYLTTRSDPRHRPTVMELLPVPMRSLFPVGRLDMSVSGVLLLTDDGDFALRVAHPRYGITKTYAVTVRGIPGARTLERAVKGVRVEGQWLRVSSARVLSRRSETRSRRKPSKGSKVGAGTRGPARPNRGETTRLRVVLQEGRYREIWRLFQTLGHPVLDLHREKVGFLSDRGLPSGAFRTLDPSEVTRLLESSRASTRPRQPARKRKAGRG